jgi:rhodanese-related sulfurtransferase
MNSDLVPWLVTGGVIAVWFLFRGLGQISSAEARKLVSGGAKLVDVRSPGEFGTGHLPGAVNVPVGDLGAKRKLLGAKDQPVVLYCASGARSAVARSVLKAQGFEKVFNLGSMSRW